MAERRLVHFARTLRKGSTEAERRIWFRLRTSKLNGHVFRRQHPLCGYIADFYCNAAKLVVELDGGQHNEAEAIEYDQRRTKTMEADGNRVIRFSDYDVLRDTDAVVLAILKVVESQLEKRPPP